MVRRGVDGINQSSARSSRRSLVRCRGRRQRYGRLAPITLVGEKPGHLSNEATLSTHYEILPSLVDFSDALNNNSMISGILPAPSEIRETTRRLPLTANRAKASIQLGFCDTETTVGQR
jgi:hypothetical protein